MTEEDKEKLASYRLLMAEISAEIRSRRDPELIFTAAVVGALGAVAWGVAAASMRVNMVVPVSSTPATSWRSGMTRLIASLRPARLASASAGTVQVLIASARASADVSS